MSVGIGREFQQLQVGDRVEVVVYQSGFKVGTKARITEVVCDAVFRIKSDEENTGYTMKTCITTDDSLRLLPPEMMICPKAGECQDCHIHCRPHEKNPYCEHAGDICPACIPYKPAPEKMVDVGPIVNRLMIESDFNDVTEEWPMPFSLLQAIIKEATDG